jgi:hypothetical protein
MALVDTIDVPVPMLNAIGICRCDGYCVKHEQGQFSSADNDVL